jgi:hypothetical protein
MRRTVVVLLPRSDQARPPEQSAARPMLERRQRSILWSSVQLGGGTERLGNGKRPARREAHRPLEFSEALARRAKNAE